MRMAVWIVIRHCAVYGGKELDTRVTSIDRNGGYTFKLFTPSFSRAFFLLLLLFFYYDFVRPLAHAVRRMAQ